MTAVLSPSDPLRRDRMMSSLDDSDISYSSNDWRAKYNEVAEMLAETRAELDEFHHASKELEAELENELQRTEKAQQDLKIKVSRAETERDEWKSKFMSLQTTHNTTTTSLQRELDKLRQDHQQIKIQLRDLEMGNDDLERNERAVSSSLADIEAKYTRALEEKILLEHELLDKASLEEETQRLKDELRDANVEISILRDQLAAASSASASARDAAYSTISLPLQTLAQSEENLLKSQLPPTADDLHLSELVAEPGPKASSKPRLLKAERSTAHYPDPMMSTPVSSSSLGRSSSLRQSPSLRPTSTPLGRSIISRNPSSITNAPASSSSTIPSTVSKNKGVQMVSEMRARVRNLEQKIHTRVPRLRMGSINGRPNANTLAMSTINSTAGPSRAPLPKSSAFEKNGSLLGRRSSDSSNRPEEPQKKNSGRDNSGWVLIMEDSPSPPKPKMKERPRQVSPSRPSPSTSPTLSVAKLHSLDQSTSGLRRPQSRLSGTSISTSATTSSITTPSSRPSTPTFLPLPTSGLYAHGSTAGSTGLKYSVGPNGKRSSLGSSMNTPTTDPSKRARPVTMPPPLKSGSANTTPSNAKTHSDKTLPHLPGGHTNVTIRSSKLPTGPSASSFTLSQSRIGRLSSGGAPSGRRSVGETDGSFLGPAKAQVRARSGSSADQRY